MTIPPPIPTVQAIFDACTPPNRAGLLQLRGLIFTCAGQMPEIGPLAEGIRWGQPAYLTPETRAACSLRIGPVKPDGFGLYVHCRSTLIPGFAAGPGAGLTFEGTRAVRFQSPAEIDASRLSFLIRAALSYHLPKLYCFST